MYLVKRVVSTVAVIMLFLFLFFFLWFVGWLWLWLRFLFFLFFGLMWRVRRNVWNMWESDLWSSLCCVHISCELLVRDGVESCPWIRVSLTVEWWI